MNRQEKNLLLEVYRDCLRLEKRGELTEYGRGQKDLCKMLTRKNLIRIKKEPFYVKRRPL